MLYYLGTLFEEWNIAGSRLLHYVTFRAVLAFIVALLFTTIFGGRIIKMLHKREIGETIRNLGLEGQQQKHNTPTMGGIIIILSILIPTLLFARLNNIYIVLMLVTTLLMGSIGFLDDYIKVFRKNKQGLSGKYKIVGQVATGLIIGLVLVFSPQVTIKENVETYNVQNKRIEKVEFSNSELKSTKTTIPFVKNNNFDYSNLSWESQPLKQQIGWIIYTIAIILIVTFISNCVNLTDGLDGLASGTSAPVGFVLMLLAYVSSHIQMASYLNIMFIPGSEELVIFGAAFVGATMGFLWFNSYPAQVFMGDTGSLTLGGIIAVFAIIIRKELLLPILCGLFIVEGLSSLMQTSYFKITKRRTGVGKRIFKMSPLHHHFQKVGNSSIDALIQRPYKTIPENKIVIRFWLIGLVLAALAVATLKMR